MKTQHIPQLAAVAAPHKHQPVSALLVAALLSAGTVLAQDKPAAPAPAPASADGVLDLLVHKGVLTPEEVRAYRSEAEKTQTASQTKSPVPDWVTNLKVGGDFRGRFDHGSSDNDRFVSRDRFRYRLRFGAVATLKDDFDIGLRLTSGEPVSGFSNGAGSPVSGNATLQDNATRKFVYIDLAYAKWNAIHSPSLSGSLSFGKMENPFLFSANVFDPDYNPEGFAGQFKHAFNSRHSLSGAFGWFVLDELAASSSDPYLTGAQLLFDSKWSKNFSTSLGGAVLSIGNAHSLANANVPNVNRGNTRDASSAPTAHFNPVIGTLSATYTLDRMPGYRGAFPIKLAGEFLDNPAVSTKNKAFMGGITFGKAGKKGLWELSYQYRYAEANSWYEEVIDDDLVAYYQVQQPNSGFSGLGAGAAGGTNIRGHVVKGCYSITDSLTCSVTYAGGSLIDASPANSKSHVDHILVDLMWKF